MDKELGNLANNTFSRVSARLSNARLISDLVRKVYLRESVVACLDRIEREDIGINWWQDGELMSIFKNMSLAGVLPLPVDSVERIRWIALIIVLACKFEGFSYGNLLIPLDYLPDKLLDDSYGESILSDVQNLRESLRAKGWGEVFGW